MTQEAHRRPGGGGDESTTTDYAHPNDIIAQSAVSVYGTLPLGTLAATTSRALASMRCCARFQAPAVEVPRRHRSRPGEKAAPESALNESGVTQPTVSRLTDAFVCVVLTPKGTYRRRVYLSLRSAEKAVRRAWAADRPARLVLCRMIPVTEPLDGRWTE